MKTLILNLALCFSLLISLSSCLEDLEFPDLSGLSGLGGYGGGSYNWGTPYGYGEYAATFYIDSVVQLSDSKVKIWAHIQYDSVLIIENRKVRYRDETLTEISEVIQSEPDTLSFRALPDSILNWEGRYEWIYKYAVEVNSLKKDFDYFVCISNGYTQMGLYWSTEQCINVRLK